MHEAHGPEKPIHSPKEFLLHMLTVMLGLLLALGLEAIVEWRHHQHLAHQATENIRRELAENETWLDATLSYAPDEEKYLVAVIGEMKKVKASDGKATIAPPATIGWTFNVLARANYDMAQANGALSYMKFEDAARFAAAYTLQQELVVRQTEAWTSLGKLGACSVGIDDPTHPSLEDAACRQAAAREMVVRVQAVENVASFVKKAYADARGTGAGH